MESKLASLFQPREDYDDHGSSMKIRRPASLSSTLPAIFEDESCVEPLGTSSPSPPDVPPRSARRLSSRDFVVVGPGPPRFNHEESPPSYWEDDNSNQNKESEKFTQWRRGVASNKHIVKRGGWLRLCLIAGAVLLFVLGLVLALVFGLRGKGSQKRNSSTGNSTAAFPVGSYSINTFLSNTATSCTSNSNTWLCYPFSTYSQSPTASAAIFDWIISSNPLAPTTYTISSTQNPFSIMFANITLLIRDQNTDDEHYFFASVMNKATRPTTQIGRSNAAATCNFNATFQASLYTKRTKTYPSGNSSGAFEDWPYAVEVRQVASSAPECVDSNGNSFGDFAVEQQGQECSCDYDNTGE